MPDLSPMRFRLWLRWALAASVLLALSLTQAAAQQNSPPLPAAQQEFQQGLLALQSGHFADAVEKFTAARRGHPHDARIRNFLGIALAALGRNSEAAAQYQQAIRLDPVMEDAYRNLGFLEWNLHHLTAAVKALTRAVELSPHDSFAHYYLGRVYLDGQQYAQACEQLEQSRAAWPNDAGFLIEAAQAYAALGRAQEAGALLRRAVNLPLDDAQAAATASVLLHIGEHSSAVSLLRRVADSSSADKAWARFDLALAELAAGHYDDALRDARQYTETAVPPAAPGPQLASAWCLIGIANARLARTEAAVNAFQKAAELAPQQEENWLNLTRELMDMSRYADAIAQVQQGLAANPQSYALHLRLGAAQMAAGRYPEAEAVFRELVAAGDPLPTSYVGLAQVLLRLGRAQEAVAELSAARQKLGPNFLISYFLGLALEHAGKPAPALAAFQEAARQNPASADVHIGIGKMELASGHPQQAIPQLQQALRLDAGNRQARRLLSAAYRRIGDTQNATRYAQAGADAPELSPRDLIGDFFLPKWQVPPSTPPQSSRN